jgi:hypothetical protein
LLLDGFGVIGAGNASKPWKKFLGYLLARPPNLNVERIMSRLLAAASAGCRLDTAGSGTAGSGLDTTGRGTTGRGTVGYALGTAGRGTTGCGTAGSGTARRGTTGCGLGAAGSGTAGSGENRHDGQDEGQQADHNPGQGVIASPFPEAADDPGPARSGAINHFIALVVSTKQSPEGHQHTDAAQDERGVADNGQTHNQDRDTAEEQGDDPKARRLWERRIFWFEIHSGQVSRDLLVGICREGNR